MAEALGRKICIVLGYDGQLDCAGSEVCSRCRVGFRALQTSKAGMSKDVSKSVNSSSSFRTVRMRADEDSKSRCSFVVMFI